MRAPFLVTLPLAHLRLELIELRRRLASLFLQSDEGVMVGRKTRVRLQVFLFGKRDERKRFRWSIRVNRSRISFAELEVTLSREDALDRIALALMERVDESGLFRSLAVFDEILDFGLRAGWDNDGSVRVE